MTSARRITAICLAWGGLALPAALSSAAEEDAARIEDGNTVLIEYTLTLEDGTELDTNVGQEPLPYEHGAEQIVPGLEAALDGLAVGDTRHVTVSPEDGYGPVREEAFQEVALDRLPEEARVAGAFVLADDGAGHTRPIRVHEIKEESAVLDFNHVLAGKTLIFDVKVIEIR